MANESEGIDINLSEEDSPADILNESEDISLFSDDSLISKELTAEDSKLEEDLSDSEDDDLKLGMDEIGDLVDEIKLDDQEEENADEKSNAEGDMVFDETESQLHGSSELESALDELGEEESLDNSMEEVSSEEESSQEDKDNFSSTETESENEDEIVAESNDSENEEISEDSIKSSESESVTDAETPEESESGASKNDEQTEEEEGSSDVMDMLHDPDVAEDISQSESVETEDLDLGMEELDDTLEEETISIKNEEADNDSSASKESEIDVIEDLDESEADESEELGLGSSGGLENVSEELLTSESKYQEDPEIENVSSAMSSEQDKPEEPAASLGSKMLLSLHHTAVVEIARTTLTGEEITQITYGSIIELDKAAGEPVELVIEGKTIARGEIVQINNDKLGIRIVGIV
ncbi:MAG: flagellar motor switch protein FliN [Deltaproteobacteria bacterium]|nr:flagellar motor switch protein FliN [Deltaproteobacteria bacterium]